MKVLIVSAHPDEEVIGAGGTLLRHKKNGDELTWLIITNIFTIHGFSDERVKSRQEEINVVANRFGFANVIKLDYPTMSLSGESLLTMIPAISKVFNDTTPEVIYVLNRSDVHSDHRIVFDAV